MAPATQPPKNIGELIDHIERIREELLSIQRSMEKMEPESIVSVGYINKKVARPPNG